jgi:hypothetical protein
MVFVYLENNIVKDAVRVDPFTVFLPEYASQFISIENNEVGIGWSYDGTTFTAPVQITQEVIENKPPTLEELQAQLLVISQQMAALANTSG